MNILRHFSGFPRSPDEPAADPAAEPVEAVAAVEPAPEPVVEPAPAPEPKVEAPPMVPLRVLQERVGEETNKRQSAEERATAAEARNREYEQIVRRMQADPKATPADPAPAPTERRAATPQTDVEREAQQIVLRRDLENVSHAGVTSYGAKWGDAVNRLNAYGANSAEFVASVLEIDPAKAHEIMFQISQDGEKAVSLARMSPVRRAAEITRMIDMAAAPKTDSAPKVDPKPDAPAISKAPAPKPALAPRAPAPEVDPTTPEGDEKLTGEQWNDWYKNKYLKRSA